MVSGLCTPNRRMKFRINFHFHLLLSAFFSPLIYVFNTIHKQISIQIQMKFKFQIRFFFHWKQQKNTFIAYNLNSTHTHTRSYLNMRIRIFAANFLNEPLQWKKSSSTNNWLIEEEKPIRNKRKHTNWKLDQNLQQLNKVKITKTQQQQKLQ